MKLTPAALRRIIAEEVESVVAEATRSPQNLARDLEAMQPGDVLEVRLFDGDGGEYTATISRRGGKRAIPGAYSKTTGGTYVLNRGATTHSSIDDLIAAMGEFAY
jgi:hypothetical protein